MEPMESEDDLPRSATTPATPPGADPRLANEDSPLKKLLHVARTANDAPQTGIDSTLRLTKPCVSNKGELLAYVSQLICWDLDHKVLSSSTPCVVAAALVNDHGPRFVIGVSARDGLSTLYEAILNTLPRAIAQIPVDHVVEKYYPQPGDWPLFRVHAEQQIGAYVRAVYGRAVRRTMGAIGIADADRTLTSDAGVNEGYAYLAGKCVKALQSAASVDLTIQVFWYRYGQRPPREMCSPQYLIESGIEYQRDR